MTVAEGTRPLTPPTSIAVAWSSKISSSVLQLSRPFLLRHYPRFASLLILAGETFATDPQAAKYALKLAQISDAIVKGRESVSLDLADLNPFATDQFFFRLGHTILLRSRMAHRSRPRHGCDPKCGSNKDTALLVDHPHTTEATRPPLSHCVRACLTLVRPWTTGVRCVLGRVGVGRPP